MSFQNLYYKRTAGTAKACFVCYRPTTTVLATINTVDFLYTCTGHLADVNFASQVKESGNATKKQVTAEEIAKVKEEWEEKRRKEKEKATEAENDKKDGDGKKNGKDKEKESGNDKEKKKKDESLAQSSPPPSTPAPAHERYILHRDFFAMRQAEHRKLRQTVQAKELAPRLPGVPNGSVE